VRLKMAAAHTDLLADGSVVHEAKLRRVASAVARFSANGGYLPANGGTARRDKIRTKPRKELLNQTDHLVMLRPISLDDAVAWFFPRIIFER
jgi:hypothetical protein